MTKDQIKRAQKRMKSLQEEMDKIDIGAFVDQAELVSGDLGNALVEIASLNQRLDEQKGIEEHLLDKIDNQIGELEKVDKKLSEALEKISGLGSNASGPVKG